MKQVVFFATAVAGWLLLGLMPLFAQGTLPGVGRPPAGGVPAGAPSGGGGAATAGALGTSVTVIDLPYIFKGHVRFKAEMDAFKKEVDDFEAWVRNEQKKLTDIRDEVLEKYRPNTDQFKAEDERLAKLGSDLQIKVNVKKREFLEKEAKIFYKTYNEVIGAVTQFAERNRISLVLRFNGDDIDPNDRNSIMQGVNRNIVYQRNLDISDMILTMVNGPGSAPQPTNNTINNNGGLGTRPTNPLK